jgi:hypothetical protein
MESPKLIGMTQDQHQRRRLTLKKGDIKMPAVSGHEARQLRRILGYDLSKVATNDVTRNAFLESAGWHHVPSSFVVSAGVEDTERWGPLLHISMSYPTHDPTWEEIKAMREIFFPPDMDVAMMLPRRGFYVNVHPHCFHLWQTPQEWGIG